MMISPQIYLHNNMISPQIYLHNNDDLASNLNTFKINKTRSPTSVQLCSAYLAVIFLTTFKIS